jgi:hypothetical protein
VIKISWRLADTLGYAAFSPDKAWQYEELIAFLPNSRSSWLLDSADAAKAEIDARLAPVMV